MSDKAERVLTIKGMDCADCAAHVEKEVSKVPGVLLPLGCRWRQVNYG
jgi:copper chaperone CopZ